MLSACRSSWSLGGAGFVPDAHGGCGYWMERSIAGRRSRAAQISSCPTSRARNTVHLGLTLLHGLAPPPRRVHLQIAPHVLVTRYHRDPCTYGLTTPLKAKLLERQSSRTSL